METLSIHNRNGLRAKLIGYGATLSELWVPDRLGKLADIVLGFDDPERYLGPHPFFGGTIGRYANRIAQGRFSLDGKTYHLATNHGPNHLHGGTAGFDRRLWQASPLEASGGSAIRFTRLSEDGEEGFPGNLHVSVTYALSDYNELRISYEAKTDRATPLTLTNHSYFNLAGKGNILHHLLFLNADAYTPVDVTLIPTGELRSVQGTALDFRVPTEIGARIADLPQTAGYDHNFVLNGKDGGPKLAARVRDPSSGREMEIWTTEPGIQFFSGSGLEGIIGKGGVAYERSAGFCLEPQHFPDSPNRPEFPSAILQPGARFFSESVYKFSAR